MACKNSRAYRTNECFCVQCGKSMPVMRPTCNYREKGHRKKMYCPYCKVVINHIDCRNQEQIDQFKLDFAKGKYKDEAIASIEYTDALHSVWDSRLW